MNDDEYLMKCAEYMARNSRCRRRAIGCVLVDTDNVVIAHGFNGTPMSIESCIDVPCPDAEVEAGKGKGCKCYGVHSEIRALMSLNDDAKRRLHACYSNKAPCTTCVATLLETNCQKIVFRIPSNETDNKELWESAGREWVHLPEDNHVDH